MHVLAALVVVPAWPAAAGAARCRAPAPSRRGGSGILLVHARQPLDNLVIYDSISDAPGCFLQLGPLPPDPEVGPVRDVLTGFSTTRPLCSLALSGLLQASHIRLIMNSILDFTSR